MKTPSDKVALITGSSRGIGLAIAKRLCQDGYRVVLNSSKEVSLSPATQELAQQFGEDRIFGVTSDVSDEQSVRVMFERIQSHWGRLDVLMNNAGISPRLNGEKPTVETTPAEHWLQTIAINLTGTFYTCKYALPLMKPQGWGRIINMPITQPARRESLVFPESWLAKWVNLASPSTAFHPERFKPPWPPPTPRPRRSRTCTAPKHRYNVWATLKTWWERSHFWPVLTRIS